MKILSVTTLFPSRAQPVHAIFVYNRLKHVAEHQQVRGELRIIAPIPYFPFDRFISKYTERHRIPRADKISGLEVLYPRFLSIPALLKPLDGIFVLLSVWWAARRLRREFDFDVIDTHLAFPDGFAGVFLAWLWKKPLTITLRGHDVNVLPRFPVRKRQIQFALRHADRIIGVADALRRGAIALGADPNKAVTISNGVDLTQFFPVAQAEARQRLGLPQHRRIVLSVGRIVENKGYHLIVEALQQLRAAGAEVPYLVLVGGAADEALYPTRLKATVAQLGMKDDVLLAGPQRNETLRDWYCAADVYCLASETEGWPNVLLESLACGTPVVATKTWGTPEIICSDEYGLLVDRSAESIAQGLQTALAKEWKSQAMIAYAATHTWQNVAEKVVANFASVITAAQSSP
ncbi:MAG TPA: glycosyltransferase [Blastocatellia bacterium]|nr:glycosyltransferase [Blastocatellia bacterium]